MQEYNEDDAIAQQILQTVEEGRFALESFESQLTLSPDLMVLMSDTRILVMNVPFNDSPVRKWTVLWDYVESASAMSDTFTVLLHLRFESETEYVLHCTNASQQHSLLQRLFYYIRLYGDADM